MDIFLHVGLRIMEKEWNKGKKDGINHAEDGYEQIVGDKNTTTYRKKFNPIVLNKVNRNVGGFWFYFSPLTTLVARFLPLLWAVPSYLRYGCCDSDSHICILGGKT